jgi:hypothetical protein
LIGLIDPINYSTQFTNSLLSLLFLQNIGSFLLPTLAKLVLQARMYQIFPEQSQIPALLFLHRHRKNQA